MHYILLLALVGCAAAQFDERSRGGISCGFSCTRNAAFSVNIDGQNTRATCSDGNVDPKVRCDGCCKAYALSAGLDNTAAAGFPSTDGRGCVCCIHNDSDRCSRRG